MIHDDCVLTVLYETQRCQMVVFVLVAAIVLMATINFFGRR